MLISTSAVGLKVLAETSLQSFSFYLSAILPRGCLGMDDKLGGWIPDALFVVIRVLSSEPGWFLVIHVVEFVWPLGGDSWKCVNGDKCSSFCLESDQGGEARVERAWQRRGEMCQDLPKPGLSMTAGGFKEKYIIHAKQKYFLNKRSSSCGPGGCLDDTHPLPDGTRACRSCWGSSTWCADGCWSPRSCSWPSPRTRP